MKLPKKKQQELEDKGKPAERQTRGGGAMGRLRQFQKERGLEKTELSNPASEKSGKDKAKRGRASKK
ncbi:MAG TPA: hypothetical protein VEW46_23935 [Pyrinomonadaceae bacterium]|nr:hypothetical protein [Pyrinomonadaceae bacterium]